MSLQLVANHLAQKGRGPDSTLVHMSNREVAGLQALAQKHGGQLSVNPDTGLPEAGFLDNLLPMVAGAGLTYFSGGAINPMMAGGIIGGITALDSKDLSKGLVAGLGAYGGAGMVGGLAGLGAEGAYGAGAAGEAARAAGTEAAIANGTYQSQVGTGLSNFADAPMKSLSALGGGSAIKGSLPILEGLAPAAVEAFDEEDEGDGAPAQHKGYIRKYALDPVTGQYKQVGAYEAGGDPNVDVSSKAGTAGAFGGVGQSEYEAAQGMAEGGTTSSDSSRIYDYLMGRGPNPMQFKHTTSPQVDYNVNKTPAPITPTTPILEEVYDPYGNRSGGSGGTAEQREQREKDWNAPQDYLSIDRVNPDGTISKDVQSNASLAAMSPSERAMHMADVRRINPIRTFVSDAVTKIGVLPILSNVYDHFAYGNLGRPLPPGMPRAPVEDRVGVSTPEFYAKEVEADLERQQAATEQLRRNIAPSDAAQDVRIAQFDAGRTHEGGGGGQGPTGPQSAASRSSDGPGQSGSGGWGRGATGGLATHYGIEHMAHGGIANLYNLGSYSDGGRLLKGPGDGVSDDIPATIGHGQPARLADGEFVIPARIVSEIGNGSTDAGARELYKMMDRVQAGRRKTVGKDQVAKNSKAVRHLPA